MVPIGATEVSNRFGDILKHFVSENSDYGLPDIVVAVVPVACVNAEFSLPSSLALLFHVHFSEVRDRT